MLHIKRELKSDWLTQHLLANGTKIDSILPQLTSIEVNDFESDSGADFDGAFWELVDSRQPFVPIIVDSYGGQVYTLMRFLDTIEAGKKAGVKVMTIGRGKCMSCGSVLVSAGTAGMRYLDHSATIMVHEVSSGIWSSKNEEIQSSADETDRLNKYLLEKLSEHAGKQKGFFKKEIHRRGHADWFLDARESVHIGLVDKIGSPKLSMNLVLDIKFEK